MIARKFLVVASMVLMALRLEAQTAAAFTLTGQVEGFADSSEVKLVRSGENTPLATGRIVSNQFVLTGNLPEPSLVFLFLGDQSQPAELFLESKPMLIKGAKGNPGAMQLEGSTSHALFQRFISAFVPYVQLRNQQATALNGSNEQTRDSLMAAYNATNQTMQQQVEQLVKQEPASPVTSFVLAATFGFFNDMAWLEKRYELLQAPARQSASGMQVNAMIQDGKIGAVGSKAIDFTQADTSGKMVSLSSFKGKYVLVDFWASWCGPCRQENPNVVDNFNKFKGKNFTVLGVSLDREDQRAKWLEAIKKDKLTWTHVSDLKFWNNEAARLYRVNGIPYNFLVDPSGTIIAKNLRGPALEAKLCEVLGCK
ncbi:MAG: AhpC/TSA family protein [Sphingomonadales bacterium]|nr:AhpC/TSA family protein [Sphingomonadales bacterium]